MKVSLCVAGLILLIGTATASTNCYQIGPNCKACNGHRCTNCDIGYCGADCSEECIGKCLNACDIKSCKCNLCADSYYGKNCSLPCSKRCLPSSMASGLKRTCDMETGACKEGCISQYCSRNRGCNIACGKNCISKSCDFDCFCNYGCVDGFYDYKCERACPRGPCKDACLKCDREKGTCTKCSHGEEHNETDPVPNCKQCCKLNCTCSQTTKENPQCENKTPLHVVIGVLAVFLLISVALNVCCCYRKYDCARN